MNKIILLLLACICAGVTRAQTRLTAGVPTANGQVLGIEPVGDTVYVWGQFSLLGDSSRNGFGSFNIRTGKVTAFNPRANAYANSVTIAGNRMLVTGNFDTIGGQPHLTIALLDLGTGNVENWSDTGSFSFSPNVAGYDSTYFYFFNGSNIKRVNYHTNTTSAWRTPPVPTYGLNAICVTDSFIYVGGSNFNYTGADSVFNYLCRFKKADGSLDRSWHPQPNCVSGTEGMEVIGVNRYKQLFVAGEFSTIAGQARQGIAGFDAHGTITNFNPNNSSSESLSMAVTDNDVWLGCNSHLIGGQYRWRLAEIDINSGAATCWDASAVTQSWSFCNWVSVAGDTVYAANYGSTIFVFTGSPRPHPAANVIQGPISVNAGQAATYGVPDSLGFTYSWLIEGGTGYSINDTISVTWGNGPVGIIKMVENNNNYSTCSSDTVELIINILLANSVQDMEEISATVSPNPAAGNVRLVTTGTAKHYAIYDITGKLLVQAPVNSPAFDIDLGEFTPGVYIIAVQGTSKEAYVKLTKL